MNTPFPVVGGRLAEPSSSVVTVAHAVYALHAVSLCVGAWTAATVVGSFLFGWPSIIAVILNYVMRSNAEGTWLESHFRWQIRTFWLAVAWSIVIALISAPLALVLVGFATWAVGFFVLGVWAFSRVAKGWWALKNGEELD
ncbi:MAG: hypothetical protein ABW321_21185 [Polyangiales bacterium]